MRISGIIFLALTCLLFAGATAPARAELESMPESVVSESQEGEAGHHEAGEHKKGLPQFDPSSFASQVFWLAIAFGVLYTVFSRKTLPDIGAVQKRRRAHIEHDIASAQKLRESAEVARARYERAVADAQQQSTKLFLKAEEEVKLKTTAGLEEFRNRSARQIKETEDYIDKAKKDAMEGIHAVAAEIASLAAEKIVGISTDIDQAKSVVKNINKKAA
jgi:F-type H+-transporting ATPase subunit b